MPVTRRHAIKDGLRIAAVTFASFGVFYFALAQTGDSALITPDDTASGSTTTAQFVAPASCGDGIIAGTEQCDGNPQQCGATGCRTCVDCAWKYTINEPRCGDGIQSDAEPCDPSSPASKYPPVCAAAYGSTCNFCTPNCTVETMQGPKCGDNSVNGNEQCDGNPQECTATECRACVDCSWKYTLASTTSGETTVNNVCGDGVKAGVEGCDNGREKNGIACAPTATEGCSYCSAACQTVTLPKLETANVTGTVSENFCGDGIKAGAEGCDNGASRNGQVCAATATQACYYCSSSCQFVTVPKLTTTTDNTDTALANACGDGVKAGVEGCDNGREKNGIACAPTATEGCSYCSAACQTVFLPKLATTIATAACGDGIKNGVEACDPKDASDKYEASCVPVYGSSCAYCSAACAIATLRAAYCGDGTKNGPEQCEGDQKDCSGTSCRTCVSCKWVSSSIEVVTNACGNGKRDTASGEQCDRSAGDPAECVPSYGGRCNVCSVDCRLNTIEGPKCGDGVCSKDKETSATCAVDCPAEVRPTTEADVEEPVTTNAEVAETPSEPIPVQERPVALSELCVLKGVTSPEACAELVKRMMFSVASTSISTEKDVVRSPAAPESGSNAVAGVSEACVSKGATTAEECRAIVVASAVSDECRRAGAFDDESCKKVLASLSADCKSIGATSAEECERAMKEKFVPLECRQKGIFTREACDASRVTGVAVDTTQNAAMVAAAKEYFPAECEEQGLTDLAICKRYLAIKNLPEACRAAGIEDSGACDSHLRATVMAPACAAQGITDSVECKEHMYRGVANGVSCVGLGAEECAVSLRERNLGKVVDAQASIAKVNALFRDDAGNTSDASSVCFKDRAGNTASADLTNVPIVTRPCLKDVFGNTVGIDLAMLKKDDPEKFEEVGDVMPFKKGFETTLRLIKSEEQMALGGDESLRSAGAVMVAFDADGDSVPDDVEKRFGLDPQNGDTDGDGTGDAEEFRELAKKGIDKAIANGATLGQPLTEGTTDDRLTIKLGSQNGGVDRLGSGDAGATFTGSGAPGEVVTIYVYSDMPVVVTTTVDENGQWSYSMGETLKDGPHEAYVVINDDEGRVTRKSSPLALFIQGASAATAADAATESVAAELLDAQANALQGSVVETNLTYFIVGGLALVLVAFALLAAIMRQKDANGPPAMGA